MFFNNLYKYGIARFYHDDIYPLLDLNSVCGDRRSVAPVPVYMGQRAINY